MSKFESTTPIEVSSLNPPLCSLHKDNNLEFYCKVCVTPICTNCALTEHNEHKPVDISYAFNEFVATTVQLQQDVEDFKETIQGRWENVELNATRLEENNEKCRNNIATFVEEMKNMIKEMEERLLKELGGLYANKKKMSNSQIDELSAVAADVNSSWNFISQLLTSNKSTAMLSSHQAVMSLKDKLKVLPKAMEPKNDGELHFIQKEESFIKSKCNIIGHIVEYPLHDFKITIDSLTVTQGEKFEVKITEDAKSDNCVSNITATLREVIREEITSSRPKVEQQSNGDCVITGMCTSAGVWNLNVRLGDKPIKGSPLIINVEREPLEDTIEINAMVTDIVMTNEEYLLIAYLSSEILQLQQLTNDQSMISISQNVNVHRMHQLETNGNIVFSDTANKCINICKPDGHMIKSIGKGLMMYPCGLDVNESTNTVYVADFLKDCIFIFNLDNDHLIRVIGFKGSEEGQVNSPKDVVITKEGDLIVADTWNHRIQMFDNEGSFIQILVQQGREDGKVVFPCALLIDKEENIIVASEHKLQLFTRNGDFVKRIDRNNDGIKTPQGLCMISQNPRRVAVTNLGYKNVKIFNY